MLTLTLFCKALIIAEQVSGTIMPTDCGSIRYNKTSFQTIRLSYCEIVNNCYSTYPGQKNYNLPLAKNRRVIDNISPGGIALLMMVSVCVMSGATKWSNSSKLSASI